MNICIIPARGGSKRIPKKNIKNFCGRPIIQYSIEIAKQSKLFKHIVVSTDNEILFNFSSYWIWENRYYYITEIFFSQD